MVDQTVKEHMAQGAKNGSHDHCQLRGNRRLRKPMQLMVRDLLIPLAQQEVADHWSDEHHHVRNDQRTENGVGWAMQHVRTGQHTNAWLNVHGNLRDAEGDHADVSVQCGLGNERGAQVKWCKWQFLSPF